MKKDLIIIALIILVIYFYYQNQNKQVNNQPIISEDNSETISQLQAQVNHFQTLYQSRVEKDVGDSEKVKELTAQLTLCEEIINKPLNDATTQTELTEKDIVNLNKSVEYYQQKEKVLQETNENYQQEIRALKLDKENLLKIISQKELLELASQEQESETEQVIPSILSHKDRRKMKKK